MRVTLSKLAGKPLGRRIDDADANNECTWVRSAEAVHEADVQIVKSAPKKAAANGAVGGGAEIDLGMTAQVVGGWGDGRAKDSSAANAAGDAASTL
jgi:hypothetical protein